jgi:type II secretory pathway pseudopilin PulG
MRRPGLQRGFSYLLLLFAVAALGIAGAGSAVMWSTLTQSERERELLFIGGEFARALQRYHDASPVEPKRYPANLQELVEDKRQPTPARHLRKIYFDPMTRSQDWGLVMTGGQIRAVYSKSEKVARIRVLPAWVDATGKKVSGTLKSPPPGSPSASPTASPPRVASAAVRSGEVRPGEVRSDDVRYADWLFVPMSSTPGASSVEGEPGGTGNVGGQPGSPGTTPANQSPTTTRSQQEIYTQGGDPR